MPVAIKIKADFGDDIYIRKDPEQVPYSFIGFRAGPGHIIYILSNGFEDFEAYDFQCSFDRDEALRLSFVNQD